MKYTELDPPKELQHIITKFWEFSIEPSDLPKNSISIDHYFPPSGSYGLTVINSGTRKNILLVGPQTEFGKVEVYLNTAYSGIHFKLGVAPSLFRIDKQAGPSIYDLTKNFDNEIYENILNGFRKYLKNSTIEISPLDQRVSNAIDKINESFGKQKLTDINKDIAIGTRQLQRLFKEQCDISLKEYSNVIRLRYALYLLLIEKDSIKQVIHKSGYVDQSHYLKELNRISKSNPTILQTYLKQIEHTNITI